MEQEFKITNITIKTKEGKSFKFKNGKINLYKVGKYYMAYFILDNPNSKSTETYINETENINFIYNKKQFNTNIPISFIKGVNIFYSNTFSLDAYLDQLPFIDKLKLLKKKAS